MKTNMLKHFSFFLLTVGFFFNAGIVRSQVSPKYNIQTFSLKFDGRRRVIIPEVISRRIVECGKPLPLDVMYETEPFVNAEQSSYHRGIMNTFKHPKYLINATPRLLPPTCEFKSLNERSVLHDVLSGRCVDITEIDSSKDDCGIKREVNMDPSSAIKKLSEFSARYKKLQKLLREIGRDIRYTDFVNKYYTCFITSSVDTLSTKQDERRITKLVTSLKVNCTTPSKLAPIQKSGTYAEIALN